MAYELSPNESIEQSVLRCAREQLDSALRALERELEGDPVEAVHSARKAIKKEQALLRLARGSLPRGRRTAERDALRAAAGKLSGMRDAEVTIQTLDQFSARFGGQLPQATFSTARQRLERERELARVTLGPRQIAQAAEGLREVRARVDEWELRDGGWRSIDCGLRRTYRAGRRAVRRARIERSDESLHAARKRVKDLWYQLRLLAPVCGPTVRGQAQEADQAAELLGADHDLAVLRQTLVREAPDVAVDLDALIGLVDYRRDELQQQAFCIAERLYAEKPGAFRRRLRRSWRAGRKEFQALQERHPAALAEASRTAG